MKKFVKYSLAGIGAMLPVLALAQQTVTSVAFTILNIINVVVLIILALAFLFFLIGVFRYITAKEDKAKTEARNNMIYGIIGLFVMFSVWGLVKILQNTFTGVSGVQVGCNSVPPLTCPITAANPTGSGAAAQCNPVTDSWICP